MFTDVALARTRTLVPISKLNFPWSHPWGGGRRGEARDTEKERDRDNETKRYRERQSQGMKTDTEGETETQRRTQRDIPFVTKTTVN